jgi:Fur family ferric uptake transcriptional regulator
MSSNRTTAAMIASTQTNHPIAETKGAAKTGFAVERACARLREAGLRITQPRVAILEALAMRGAPASIEQLHEDLSQVACDLVTVYRCLAAFQELGLVRRCYFENGTSLYQLHLEGEPVYHVVTREGNTVERIEPALAAEISSVITKVETRLKAQGYTGVSHLVEFFANAPRAAQGAPTVRVATPAVAPHR